VNSFLGILNLATAPVQGYSRRSDTFRFK